MRNSFNLEITDSLSCSKMTEQRRTLVTVRNRLRPTRHGIGWILLRVFIFPKRAKQCPSDCDDEIIRLNKEAQQETMEFSAQTWLNSNCMPVYLIHFEPSVKLSVVIPN